ncbi:hypothetical protein J8TS2_14780 [Lederbergia ruris]|uniref:Uncharacterized protein n=1 Tax=Lederbergia ruris TaxID=217495 RepID=A0ABQ4KJ56_9BACI|nr:hypothetical protein J8TS2_14780 [Lederbergia ruris]
MSKDERPNYGSKAKYAPSWRNAFVTHILWATVLWQRRSSPHPVGLIMYNCFYNIDVKIEP